MGALRQRPGLGHGPRGLQRRRRGLGLPAPRPRPEQGLSLGRGRHRRLVRPLPAHRLRPRLLERPSTRSSRNDSSASPGPEGNHGEDVKEYYFYLDATPSHSYLRFLYKYPQAEFPYETLKVENARRGPTEPEFELLDTGVFDDDRYFDIEVEYAKVTMEDLAIRIRATNRGPDPAPLHLIPHLWFRNTWSWGRSRSRRPRFTSDLIGREGYQALITDDSMVETLATVPVAYRIGARTFYAPAGRHAAVHRERDQLPQGLRPRLAQSPHPTSRTPSTARSFDGEDCTNPDGIGTKSAIHYQFDAVPPGETVTLRFRLTDTCYLDRPPRRDR